MKSTKHFYSRTRPPAIQATGFDRMPIVAQPPSLEPIYEEKFYPF
jgi:hypothetical protein